MTEESVDGMPRKRKPSDWWLKIDLDPAMVASRYATVVITNKPPKDGVNWVHVQEVIDESAAIREGE